MANKVTGSTDTTGAVSVSSKTSKSVMVVGVVTGTPTTDVVTNKVFNIAGTTEATARYGVGSPIISAVKTLISNGVTYINGIIVDSNVEGGKLSDNYAAALSATLGDDSVKCILIDAPSDASIVQELKSHLSVAESEDKFRYGVIAPASTTDSQVDLVAFAKTVASDRIFVPGPSCVDGGEAVNPIKVMAGLIAEIMTETDDPALPMNGVAIGGIGSVSRPVLEAERKILAEAGITVLYNEGGSPTVYRLVTSSQDEVWKEGTTRFIADEVLESNEALLRANYKRTKNVARILDSIKTDIKTNMEKFAGLEIIENFDDTTLSVVKDPSDMYGALVDYEFDVVTPLYTITITQHMKL